ncbi:MAG TPA: DUF481 domain-containing protein [Vicinamibacterales bacterium]|nr:DUF481 domain-containing protein [Vicinamibacterales bacterium]
MTTQSHRAKAILTIAFAVLLASTAHAQPKTDVVSLANGDRITGEIVRLERGRLEFKTDDAGTLYLEWDKLVSLVTIHTVEVMKTDGTTFVGSLQRTNDRSIAVAAAGQTFEMPMYEVTLITPIGQSFWKKLDGSFDAGFSYTKSSGIAQLNLNTDTVFRRPRFQARLSASFVQTQQEDNSRDDRGAIDISYLRYRWQRWYVAAATRFETNESLGLDLRSQVAGIIGPRLVNSNRAQLVLGAGLAFSHEDAIDGTTTENLDAVFVFQSSYFTYDRPKTTLDLGFQYYPSLSDFGRQRLQLDASVRRELLKDFYVSMNLYDTFDSRPPVAGVEKNDIGIVLSIGWSY